jgi:hypothetical protein
MNSPEKKEAETLTGNDLSTLQATGKDTQFTDRSAIQHLKALHIEAQKRKYPNNPYFSSPDFKVSTSNGLTKAVIHFLRLKGHQAERISNTGRIIDRSQVVSDVMGHRRTIGSKQWIPGTGTNGTADISSTIFGMSVKWEVKNKSTNDRQSEAQKRYQAEVEKSAGKYFIVSCFAQFLNTYYSNFGNHD